MSKKPDTTTDKTTEKPSQKSWLKYPLAFVFIFAIGAVVYQTHFKPTPRVGKGTPLTHTPKADIKVLNEADTIIDITTDVQQSTPFPKRPIKKIEDAPTTQITPEPEAPISPQTSAPTNLETAQLLQTTLELAKQHSQQQVLSAKFHTLMGLILNPTLSPTEQAAWAELTLPLAQEINAENLVIALQALTAPTQKSEKSAPSSTLPIWLAPLQNLVQVRRIDDAPNATTHAEHLKNLRAAYQSYLMNESH